MFHNNILTNAFKAVCENMLLAFSEKLKFIAQACKSRKTPGPQLNPGIAVGIYKGISAQKIAEKKI